MEKPEMIIFDYGYTLSRIIILLMEIKQLFFRCCLKGAV